MNKNYGYYVNLHEQHKEDLRHLIEFTSKTDLLFYFKNWKYIQKELKEQGYKKTDETKYENETELVYEKNEGKLFFYI